MTYTTIAGKRLPPVTYIGLVLALVGPFVPYVLDPIVFGAALTPARIEWDTLFHWLNLAAVIGVVLFVEQLPVTSIGLKRLRWWTAPFGVLAGAIILGLSGIAVGVLKATPNKHFVELLTSLPFLVRVVIVITAGVFEETLFRGYALERLATAFDSKWIAGGITVALFTLAHLPAVGLRHLLPIFIVSLLVTLLYLWRRDLVINMIAHATIDGVGLLLVPFLSHH
jgi:membrane protease YdiL (CAAX protease family)